jgi:hypothetical protein
LTLSSRSCPHFRLSEPLLHFAILDLAFVIDIIFTIIDLREFHFERLSEELESGLDFGIIVLTIEV